EAIEALALLRTAPSAVELRDLETVWQGHLRESRDVQRTLKGRVEDLQAQFRSLSDEALQWEATLTEMVDSGLESLNTRIKDELSRIKIARKKAQDRLHSILAMQYSISEQDARAKDIVDRVRQERDQFRDRLFVRDSPPLWSPMARGPGTSIRTMVRTSFSREFESAKAYLAANQKLTGWTLFVFVACLIGFFMLM